MEQLLKKYFGFEEFRPMQLEIIKNVLQKKDSLVLMPTGGGKSLCYQIPALKFEGLTIVISPLISLMKDQVDNLKANGINAEYINSTLSFGEIENIKKRIQEKEVKILYIAPERFALEEFKIFLTTLQISLIAIDEAHCISEWGHDFRKDYRNLKFLKILFPNVPIIALTATATLKVRKDILKQLSLINPQIFISSFNRENLKLIVMRKKNTFNKILSLVKKHKNESAIIYCFSRKDTEKIAQRLKKNGFEALPYHAGLSNNIRKQNQELFTKDKVNIIVATIAFGMGIDKPDVRLIIHHTFSKSIEGYYQEIGRAGRDGISSDCVLFYSKGDKRKHEFFLDQIQEDIIRSSALDKLNKMMIYCENTSCRRKDILGYFGESFLENNCNGCDICLNLPEIKGDVEDKSLIYEEVKENINYDSILFEKLRTLRKQIADERNFPPFIIFGDVSLREMSLYFPKNRDEFLRINGVGQQKLNDFGESFLKVINDYVRENNIVLEKILGRSQKKRARHLSRNYQKTKEMILKKLSIEEIAKFQELKERRIIYHIEKLIEGGETIDINYLIPSKEKFDIIKSAFEKIGVERLAPIYNYFDEKYSYEEIRLVRMIMMSKKDAIKNNMKTNYHERLEQIKEKYSNAYEPWEEDEDNKLKSLYLENISIDEIAQILKRQPSAIRSRLRKQELN
jgi:RecQ family ATP-dependent DNA helicase|tara:strand:- start:116 stop:2164 length:2049 start_codon:yes stop_codon:yes gene_type:complete